MCIGVQAHLHGFYHSEQLNEQYSSTPGHYPRSVRVIKSFQVRPGRSLCQENKLEVTGKKLDEIELYSFGTWPSYNHFKPFGFLLEEEWAMQPGVFYV